MLYKNDPYTFCKTFDCPRPTSRNFLNGGGAVMPKMTQTRYSNPVKTFFLSDLLLNY